MGLLLMFAAGYVMGARGGGESLDDVVDAMHAIRESEEFHDFVKALRTHTAHSLHGLATTLENGRRRDETPASSDLLERVRLIVGWR
jgi:predicted metalloprotease with PDZ domain